MSLLITDAGIAASIRAGDLGIEYAITHIIDMLPAMNDGDS